MNIIADVTRAHPQSIHQVLARLTRHAIGDHSITVLLYEDQMPEILLAGLEPKIKSRAISRTTSVPDVALEMAQQAASESSVTLVLTFNGSVLTMQHRLGPDLSGKVLFSPWSSMATVMSRVLQLGTLITTVPSGPPAPISDEDALSVLKATLLDRGATSKSSPAMQSQLRPLMAIKDVRFTKGHPASAAPHFIGALVERARQAQIIGVTPVPGNALIWLAAQQPLALSAPPTPVVNTESKVTMSYDEILEGTRMGPFSNVREDVFAALEELASSQMPLSQLISAALAKAKASHDSISTPTATPEKGKTKGVPWGSVREFIYGLLSKRPVFVDENGQAVAPSFATMGTKIKGLQPDFREQLDGEMILHLLHSGAEIKFMDASRLVGTMYRTRDGANEEKLFKVLAHLKSAGLVVYTADSVKLAPLTAGNVAFINPAQAASTGSSVL